MQRRFNLSLTVTCATEEILEALRRNREEHIIIYEEALVGWREKCIAALEKHLEDARNGKINLNFTNLAKPHSYASVYTTVIEMLQMHKDPLVVLTADEVRQFMQDQWEWADAWLVSNSRYSGTAANKLG